MPRSKLKMLLAVRAQVYLMKIVLLCTGSGENGWVRVFFAHTQRALSHTHTHTHTHTHSKQKLNLSCSPSGSLQCSEQKFIAILLAELPGGRPLTPHHHTGSLCSCGLDGGNWQVSDSERPSMGEPHGGLRDVPHGSKRTRG